MKIAAAGDLHCTDAIRESVAASFERTAGEADLILLAGDLTTHGEPEQAAILADACRGLRVPVCAVLGNHDHHADRAAQVGAVLRDAGITVLERGSARVPIGATEVGIVGLKGFLGGFPGSRLANFGERQFRELYAETTADVEALARELEAVRDCPLRVVLLHYAPTADTLVGEPPGLWMVLGNDRLAVPIADHAPDLVLHGHAHAGTFEGSIDGVPVHNVAIPVIGRDFAFFELVASDR